MTDPRYPIGRFDAGVEPAAAEVEAAVRDIAELPERLREALDGLTEEQIDSPYREGGWTIRQLVHHVADSHVNAYVRHKLTVTEDEPTIRPYDQTVWAESPEAKRADPEISLALLDGLHWRWVAFLRALSAEQFARRFVHPEMPAPVSLDWSVAMYAWHGRHHTAHVRGLRAARGW
jgi:hypothetical protein